MWLGNLWTQRFKNLATARRAPARRKATRRTMARAPEQIEQRVLLSTFTVSGFTDAAPAAAPANGGNALPDSTLSTLRQAIVNANSNANSTTDTINLSAGTYTLTVTNSANLQENAAQSGDLDIGGVFTTAAHTIVIQGASTTGSPLTTIDASALNDRIFQLIGSTSTTVQFRDVILKGGIATDSGTAGAQAGTENAAGGAVLNSNGNNLSFSNVVFQSNKAVGSLVTGATAGQIRSASGGALFSKAGAVSVTLSTFDSNTAQGSAGTDAIASTTAAGPGAGATGGAIEIVSGNLTMTSSAVTNNKALGGAGGAGLPTAAANTTINQGAVGGAATAGGIDLLGGGTQSLTNVTIANNLAQGGIGGASGTVNNAATTAAASGNAQGGGLRIDTSTTTGVSLLNLTVAGNSAKLSAVPGSLGQLTASSAQGGGIAIFGGTTGKVTMQNTIVGGASIATGNAATDGLNNSVVATTPGVATQTVNSADVFLTGSVATNYVTSTNNLITDVEGYTTITGTGDQTGTSGNPLDPFLAALAANGGPTRTLAIKSGNNPASGSPSPALDAGSSGGIFTAAVQFDQRGFGFPRQVGQIDVGAFESSTAKFTAIITVTALGESSVIVPATAPTTALASGTASSLRQAIINTNFDTAGTNPNTLDIIQLSAGTYTLGGAGFTNPSGTGQENATVTGDLDISNTTHALVIQGATTTGTPVTTIDASNLFDRLFQILATGAKSVTFKNLILKSGLAQDDGVSGSVVGATQALGGAILNGTSGAAGGTVSFSNVVFQSNKATGVLDATNNLVNPASGGALFSNAGTITVTASTFDSNIAQGSAGKIAVAAATASTVGAAANGGAVAFLAGGATAFTMDSSTVSRNQALGGTGGAGLDTAAANTTINPGATGGAAFGGGLDLAGTGTISLTNVTVWGNKALGGVGGASGKVAGIATTQGPAGNASGGGLRLNTTTTATNLLNLTVTSNSVKVNTGGNNGAGNSGAATGGGIAITGATTGKITIQNTIVAGNTSSVVTAGVTNQNPTNPDVASSQTTASTILSTANLIGDGAGYTGVTNTAPADQVGSANNLQNPGFGTFQNNGGKTNTISVSPSGPAADKGAATASLFAAQLPAFDQRGPGFSRIINGIPDVGAFETTPATGTGTTVVVSGSLIYGGTQTLTATVLPSGATGTVQFVVDGVNAGTPQTVTSGTATLTRNLAVGTHTVVAVFSSTSPTFSGSTSPSVNTTIGTAPLTIKADDKSILVGDPLPANTATYTGLVNGDTSASLTGTLTFAYSQNGTPVTTPSAAGTYTITPSGQSSSNYTITFATGTLTIATGTLTAVPTAQTVVYGNTFAAPTFSNITFTGFQGSDNASNSVTGTPVFTYSQSGTTVANPTLPGTYTATLSGLSSTKYVLNQGATNFTISQAPLTLTVANQTGVAGQPLPANSFTTSTLVAGDTVSNSLTGTAVFTYSQNGTTVANPSTAGTYTITLSGLSSTKYTLTNVPGTLTLTAPPPSAGPQVVTVAVGTPKNQNDVFYFDTTGLIRQSKFTAAGAPIAGAQGTVLQAGAKGSDLAASSLNNGGAMVFTIGGDLQVYATTIDATGNRSAAGFGLASAGAVNSVAATTDASGTLLLVRGQDNQVYFARFDAAGVKVTDYALAAGGAVVDVEANGSRMIVQGLDNQLYQSTFNGTAFSAYSLTSGGAVGSYEFQASTGLLVGIGLDNQLYQQTLAANGTSSGWSLSAAGAINNVTLGVYGAGKSAEAFVLGIDTYLVDDNPLRVAV